MKINFNNGRKVFNMIKQIRKGVQEIEIYSVRENKWRHKYMFIRISYFTFSHTIIWITYKRTVCKSGENENSLEN